MEDLELAATKDLESLAVTLCIELVPCCPSSVVNVIGSQAGQEDDLLPRSPDGVAQTRPKANKTKCSTGASYKTQPCRFFRSKKGCSKGAQCTYAHDEVDFQAASTKTSNFYKTRLCSLFAKLGTCSLGGSCTFAHGSDELCQRGGANPHDALQDVNSTGRLCETMRFTAPADSVGTHGDHDPHALTLSQAVRECPQNLLARPLASSQNSRGPWAFGLGSVGDPFVAAQNRAFGPCLATSSSNFTMEWPPSECFAASSEDCLEGLP